MATEPINSQTRKRNSFFKTGTAKFGSGVLVTLLAVTAYSVISGNENLVALTPPKSESISYNEMVKLQNEYKTYKKILMVRYDNPEGSGQFYEDRLAGFRFKASDLDEILHKNKVHDNLDKPIEPDEIVFYFGKEGTFRFNGSKPIMRIIAIGAQGGHLLIPQKPDDLSDKNKASIKDKADPCPGPNCPQ